MAKASGRIRIASPACTSADARAPAIPLGVSLSGSQGRWEQGARHGDNVGLSFSVVNRNVQELQFWLIIEPDITPL
jgi:hypothetical protein